MGKRTKENLVKIAVLCLALVVALTTMGVAYACHDVVPTSRLNCCFSLVVSNDNGAVESVRGYIVDPGDNGLDPSQGQAYGQPGDRHNKDVASTTATLASAEPIWGQCDPCQKYLSVSVTNAYPCYYPTIFFGLQNGGTIPGTITALKGDEKADPPDILDDIQELTVGVTDVYVGQVINPGAVVVGGLQIHVEQSAAENTSYAISVKIVFSA